MPNIHDQVEPEDREEWEPHHPYQWLEKDRLSQGLGQQERYWSLAERDARSVYSAWSRLPRQARRQVWREREIAAAMLERLHDWIRIPGAYSIGVGQRSIGGARRLCGIVITEATLLWDRELFGLYDVPATLSVPSAIPSAPEGLSVPVKVEYAPSPSQYGFVQPGSFILTSPPPIPPNTPTLQSGDPVAGQNQQGFRTPGTLTGIVSRSGTVDPLLLSAGHVFGPVGNAIVAYVPTAVVAGKVCDYDPVLDAALATPDPPWSLDYRAKGVNVVPAGPILPYTDMAVQLHGGQSGHVTAFIDLVNSIPVGGAALGIIPHFRASLVATPGDSGALLLSGHGTQVPVSGAHAKYMHPRYLASLTCAMLGLLVAGPSSQASAQTRPQAFFVSILQVLEHFNLEPWIRVI